MEYSVHIVDSVDMIDPRDPPPLEASEAAAWKKLTEQLDKEARRRLFETEDENHA